MLVYPSLVYLEMSLSINGEVVRLDIAVCIAHLKCVNEMRSLLDAKSTVTEPCG